MLNTSIRRACALLMAASVLCCATVSQAGLFDRLKPKSRRKTTVSSTAVATRRAQSPVAEPAGTSWQQPAAGAPVATPWYGEPKSSAPVYAGTEYCCGPEDRLGWHTRRCREKCDQTYYPPVPPYCFPCYGHNPTCWRRMQECYVCPREAQLPPPAPRVPKAPPAKVEPPSVPPTEMMTPPEPMDDPAAMRLRSKSRVTTARSQEIVVPPVTRSRWTSYADALPEEKEDEIPETPAETLEEMIEAEDEAQIETPIEDEVAVADEAMEDDELDALDVEDETETAAK